MGRIAAAAAGRKPYLVGLYRMSGMGETFYNEASVCVDERRIIRDQGIAKKKKKRKEKEEFSFLSGTPTLCLLLGWRTKRREEQGIPARALAPKKKKTTLV